MAKLTPAQIREQATKQKKDTTAQASTTPPVINNDIDVLVLKIETLRENTKRALQQAQKSFDNIIDLLLELHKRQDEFKAVRGETLEQYINRELGTSKQTFYLHIRAYETSPELYPLVSNKKTLVEVSKVTKEKDREKLLDQLKEKPDMSPAEIKRVNPVYFVDKTKENVSNDTEAEYSIIDDKIMSPIGYASEKEIQKAIIDLYLCLSKEKQDKVINELEKLHYD